MISDSLPNASIAMVSSNHKDFAKKKRVNRSAKLKQCKLDARREQWLSQVKNKGGCKVDVNGGGGEARRGPLMSLDNIRGRSVEKLEIKPRDEEIFGDGTDSEFSPSNSPTSHTSSLMGSSNGSGVNFTESSRSVSSRSSSSGSNGGFTETMSDEEDDSGLEDDWEAVADALAANDDKKLLDCKPEPEDKHESVAQSASSQLENIASSENGGAGVGLASVNRRAWRADDAFRPQSLPNLSKQNSFPLNSERHFGSVWGCKNVGVVPTSCPICCEDLDRTDSTFLPCSCGFRLCLFCHKRILEQDARCPGCRKHYGSDPVEAEGGSLAMRLARSCSMITRS